MLPLVVHHVATDLSVAGGPTYTVPALCSTLAAQGVTVSLHALTPRSLDTAGRYEYISHKRSPVIPKLGVSESLRKTLRDAASQSDIIHTHLLWQLPTIYPGYVIDFRLGRCHLVMSPRGTLDPWEFESHWPQKRVSWYAGQRMNLMRSSCLHATAPMERDHFRSLGLKPPIAVIPNGVDIPDLSRYPRAQRRRRRLLFVSRINPKKGIDFLLKAWRNVQDSFPDWDLHISGDPNGSHLQQMQALAQELRVARVTFECPITAERKWELYRNSDIYVLPTRGDNWAVTISDALSFGVPAIVTKEAPWQGLATYNCGWWIDLSVEALSECLRTALQTEPETLEQMGARGREWMEREFSWDSVGRKMKVTYDWLTHGGTVPEWVSL